MVIFRKAVAGLEEKALARYLARAKRAAQLRGEVNLLLTTSRELQTLNSRFRGKDKATDVLSFPAVATAAGLAGDVAISVNIAAQNARQLGHSTTEEIKILVLHGVLHLAGHDHETDDGQMARLERRLRKQLSLPVGLIERNGRSESTARPLRTTNPQSQKTRSRTVRARRKAK